MRRRRKNSPKATTPKSERSQAPTPGADSSHGGADASKRRYLLDRAARFAERGDFDRANAGLSEAFDDPDNAEAVLWALAWAPALALHRLERARSEGTMPAHIGETLATALFAAPVADVLRAAEVAGMDEAWRASAQVVVAALERLDTASTDELVEAFAQVSDQPGFEVAAGFGTVVSGLHGLEGLFLLSEADANTLGHPLLRSLALGSERFKTIANPDLAHIDEVVTALQRGRPDQAQAALERLHGHVSPALVEALGRCAFIANIDNKTLQRAERHALLMGRPQDVERYKALVFQDLDRPEEAARLRRAWVLACRDEVDPDRRAALAQACIDIAWEASFGCSGLGLPDDVPPDMLAVEDDPDDTRLRLGLEWMRMARHLAPDDPVALAGGWRFVAEVVPQLADEFEQAYHAACDDTACLDIARASLATKQGEWATAFNILHGVTLRCPGDAEARERFVVSLINALEVPPGSLGTPSDEALRDAIELARSITPTPELVPLEATLLAREFAGQLLVPARLDGLDPWRCATELVLAHVALEPDAADETVARTVDRAIEMVRDAEPGAGILMLLANGFMDAPQPWWTGVGRLVEVGLSQSDKLSHREIERLMASGVVPHTPASFEWMKTHRQTFPLAWASWLVLMDAPPTDLLREALANLRAERDVLRQGYDQQHIGRRDLELGTLAHGAIEQRILQHLDRAESTEASS